MTEIKPISFNILFTYLFKSYALSDVRDCIYLINYFIDLRFENRLRKLMKNIEIFVEFIMQYN